MESSQVTPDSFAGYPPQGRALAVQSLDLIQKLPIPFAALLMSQLILYDWLFPAERKSVDDQFAWLRSLSSFDLQRSLDGFRLTSVDSNLQSFDWAKHPSEFVEALTATLWSSHRIDSFSAAANEYTAAWRRAFPEPQPITSRLAIVVFGKDLQADNYPLFRKLLPFGVHIPSVTPTDAWAAILDTVSQRVARYSLPYGHWYVDGGVAVPQADARLSIVSWGELSGARAAILRRMQGVIRSGHGGPEELRTLMAETTTSDVGLVGANHGETLRRFQLSVLTEGSGTQIFSTTFVQWTAREILRRAQPCTLLLHFQPRQRQLPMNELLAGNEDHNAVDPAGSLVDADMGAYYTWIDQRRLTGADRAALIVWSEAHGQAIVTGPAAPRGTTAANPMTLRQIVAQFT